MALKVNCVAYIAPVEKPESPGLTFEIIYHFLNIGPIVKSQDADVMTSLCCHTLNKRTTCLILHTDII